MHDARECSSTRHSAPRPSTKLRRRNEMTHPPRIISRKRLIKPSLETPRSGSIPIDPCWIAYNYVRSRCAYSLSLSPLRRRRPLKIRPERKTCNFDNQSRERRLIFTIQRAAAFIYIYICIAWELRCVCSRWNAAAAFERTRSSRDRNSIETIREIFEFFVSKNCWSVCGEGKKFG